MYGQPMYQQPMPMYAPPKKSSALKIVLGIIGGLIGVAILIAVIVLLTCKKMTCSLGSSSYTVYYTDSSVIACFTKGNAECDLDNIKKVADVYGVSKTIDALEQEAKAQGGTCKR